MFLLVASPHLQCLLRVLHRAMKLDIEEICFPVNFVSIAAARAESKFDQFDGYWHQVVTQGLP